MESQRTAFGTVLFGGFNKSDVYQYIEQLVMDHETVCKNYERRLKDCENERTELLNKIEVLENTCKELQTQKDALEEELKKQTEAEE